MTKKFTLLLTALSLWSLGTTAQTFLNYVQIPTSATYSTGTGYRFSFDDAVLGTHTNGDGTGDSRTKTFTYSAWVCGPQTAPNPMQTSSHGGHIMGHTQGEFYSAQGSFAVAYKQSSRKLGLYCRCRKHDTDSKADYQTGHDIETDATLEAGEWAFISVVSDDSDHTMKLYKNAKLIGTVQLCSTGLGLLPDMDVFEIGHAKVAAGVADVQLWTKAMTAAELREAAAGNINEDDPDLAFWYNIDEYVAQGATTIGASANLATAGLSSVTGKVEGGTISGSSSYVYSVTSYTTSTLTPKTDVTPVNFTIATEASDGCTLTANVDNATATQAPMFSTVKVIAEPTSGYNVDAIKVTMNGEEQTFEPANAEFVLYDNATISAVATSGISSVNADEDSGEAQYYNLQGIRIPREMAKGTVIVKQGGKARKTVL